MRNIYFSRFRSPYKPENEIQLLEGKFESSTEKKESFEKPLNHISSQNGSSLSKYSGHKSRSYQEQKTNLMDSSNSINYLNNSYGSGKSFPRSHSRKQTPEYNAGDMLLGCNNCNNGPKFSLLTIFYSSFYNFL